MGSSLHLQNFLRLLGLKHGTISMCPSGSRYMCLAACRIIYSSLSFNKKHKPWSEHDIVMFSDCCTDIHTS